MTSIPLDLAVDDRPARAELFAAARPEAPAVLVIHEWWGINDDIRRICGKWVEEGFTAIAPDLYQGRSTADMAEAMALVTEMTTERAVEVMRAAALAALARGASKVGVTGFCLGGGMSIAAACNVEEIAAAAPFYGRPPEEFRRFSARTPPIQGHFAAEDAHVPREGVELMRDQATAAGSSFELFFYDAPHAFMRASDPTTHREDAAALAWSRVVPFFRRTLGG